MNHNEVNGEPQPVRLERIRYACIGTGGIADKKHLNEYSKISGVDVVAVCDVNEAAARRVAEKYGIPKVHADYLDMLKTEQLDLVSICLPNHLHASVVLECLAHGVHVHCEKPLALSAAEVESIRAAQQRSGKHVMVAMNNRFTPETQLIATMVERGFFGHIYHAKCGWRRNSGIPGIGKWFTDKTLSGGGPLIDLGVHFLDLALWLMGHSQPVSAYGMTYRHFDSDVHRIRKGYVSQPGGVFNVEDTAVGFVRLANDATVDMEFSWAGNTEKETKYLELLGEKGGCSMVNGELKFFSQMGDVCVTSQPDTATIKPAQGDCRHFAECLLNGRMPTSTVEQALMLMQAIDALYLSAAERREVRIEA